jgi:NhaP-type Na+/H+ or K+/H+ antiporter
VESLLVGLAGVVVLGVGAQWVSWRLKLPAIPFLLVAGFLAGSITGFIDPDAMFGDLLFPLVSLSVAIILFEGGLTLDVAELRVIGSVVRNLATIGVLFTWTAVAWLAHVVLNLDVGLAVLLGAILVVTGPTVIVPMLRHVRPSARVGSAVKWEGIVNDPIGVILAVLVFEVIVSGGTEQGVAVAAVGVLKAAVAGGILGLLGAGLVVLLLKRYWVPDFLQSAVTLGVVLAVHSSSNVMQTESGLLAVTVMGSALASQKTVPVHRIVEFKENLRVLLISALFIILAARLPLTNPAYTNPANLLFLAALIVVIRPVAVALATWRSILTWRERASLPRLWRHSLLWSLPRLVIRPVRP